MILCRWFLVLGLLLGGWAPSSAQTNLTFGAYRQLWTNLSANVGGLTALTNTAYNPNWPSNPAAGFTEIITNLQTAANTGMDYYGQRLRAFVIPPVSGNYTFWISSDDNSELFLSSNESPAAMVPIAWVNTWTAPMEWTKEPNQEGPPVPLVAGHRYYLEVQMQQGGGGDNLAVRWQLPNGAFEEPMAAVSPAGTLIVPCMDTPSPPGIMTGPTNTTVVEGQNAAFYLLMTNQTPVGYSWLRSGLPVAGGAAASLIVSNVSLGASGQTFFCTVSNPRGTARSATATLTVLRDTTPPVVSQAFNAGPTNVVVIYSKPVSAATATNPANYAVTDSLPITAASLAADNQTVTLATAPLTWGSNYTLVINGILDRAATPNHLAPNTAVTFTAAPFVATDIGGAVPASQTTYSPGGTLTVNSTGTGIGGTSDQFTFQYQMVSGNFDLVAEVGSFNDADSWSKAGLMARETLDPGSRFAAAFTTPAMAGSFFEWRDPANTPSTRAGNFLPNLPGAWLRLQRAGATFTGFASYDGVSWTTLGSAAISLPAQLYVGPASTSHTTNTAALVQFLNLGTTPANAVATTLQPPHEPPGPCARTTPITISEIMYKPAPRTDGNNVEFLELYNSNPWFEDLSGYQLIGANVSYNFPPGTVLGGGAYLVLAASPQGLRNVYGITNVLGPYTGSLKKSDTLQLLDDEGAILLTVPYSASYPWPAAADGTGHSIILANPTYGEGNSQAWSISDVVGGSPGQGDPFHPSPLRNVVINEFLAHSENPAVPQFVELYNHSNQTNDLSNCVITDDPATNKFVIPAGTRIPPRGCLAFESAQLGFTLNGAGGTVYFIKADGTRILDAVQYEPQADGVPLGRSPDGADTFYPLSHATAGTDNSPIRIGQIVINELMYDPISGDDDDQYIELYNQGTNSVSLSGWEFTAGVGFTFPSGAALGPAQNLVVARNPARLFTEYTNLSAANTVGPFTGKLSHKGERVALAAPRILTVPGAAGATTNTILVVEDEVTYGVGGRWGQWSHGGGSSLELVDPQANHRLAANWADSDDTMKSTWTNLVCTGILDNGANYNGGVVDLVQLGLLDVGECLVDNLEVIPGGGAGANIVVNGTFEAGLANWLLQGDHVRSGLETAAGLGGFQSAQSLHLRSSDGFWTLADYVQGQLSETNLAAGQTATLGLTARWLHGWPEVLMRLRGNWLEVTGRLPIPANLGTPGLPNSRRHPGQGPAIYEVKHSPPIPPANTPVVVTARFSDYHAFQPTLQYRIDTVVDPTPTYTTVPMLDNGTGGDGVAGDGVYSATIPAQPAGTVVAFLVQGSNQVGGITIFPADLTNNAGVPRECVVAFGDPTPTASFSQHHVFITQNWAQRWATWGGVSHEMDDGTWVDGGGRIVYNWSGRNAGSPYHQYLGSPVTSLGGMHWVMPEDDPIFGTASLNKQHVPGNGPLDDTTLQREQASFWMAHQIGLPRQNRRFYVYYVNGNRHGPLMEDAQVPDSAMLQEYWPNDNNGWLFKNHTWFEGDVTPLASGYMNFQPMSGPAVDRFTTTINGVPNQYKLARYRWPWWMRQSPGSLSDYSQIFALVDAMDTPTTSPAYYENVEAQVDTEEWLRMAAIEHATGDWDSFMTQDSWNMYSYRPTLGKWTLLKWDWNITLGVGGYSWGPDGSELLNLGPNDPAKAAFFHYPPYLRAYLRGLQDVASSAMNLAKVKPLLDAKFAAFAANGLADNANFGVQVEDPAASGGLESWIATMQASILGVLAGQGVSNVAWTVTSTVISNDVALVSGIAPIGVKTIWFNGVEWPVTWTSITNWTATIPLDQAGASVGVVGVNLKGQPVPGSSSTLALPTQQTAPSAAGQVVINEIMNNPVFPGAEYVELFNRSTNTWFDLSGSQIPALAYTFPGGSVIGPTNFLLLVADPSAFATVYGGSIAPFDTFTGTLPAAAGPLALLSAPSASGTTATIAEVSYASTAPWPAPVAGSALQLLDPRQDNWRPGNWAVVQTNRGPSSAQWAYASTYVTATDTSTLYLYLLGPGDLYLDDMQLVDPQGVNHLADGDFESPLAGNWNLTANYVKSTLSTTIKHSGNSSFHLVANAAGSGSGNAVYQYLAAPLVAGQTCNLSFWYLQNTNAGPPFVEARLASSQAPLIINPALPVPPVPAPSTPGASNSVATTLTAFPPLWINEIQPQNLTGITNRAGERAPWIEIYNPGTNLISPIGLFLANDYANPAQWALPLDSAINPGQYLTVFADGQAGLGTNGELHASFTLAPDRGVVTLSRLSGGEFQTLDYLPYTNVPPNQSYGSYPNGQSFLRRVFVLPTPGASNLPGIAGSYVAYSEPGSVYAQDFNSLPNPGASSVNTANPVTIQGVTYDLPNPFDFAASIGTAASPGGLGLAPLAGWFGLADPAASVGVRFGATDGDQTTGGVLSFGGPNSTNRALGLLATSTTGYTAFGVRVVNTSTSILNQVSVQLTGELWRQSDKAKVLQCSYLVDPEGTNAFSTNRTALLGALNVSFPTSAAAAGGVPVDGTLAANQLPLAISGQAITNWPPGAALWLVWQLADPTGKAQGLGMDNFSFSATARTAVTPVTVTPLWTGASLLLTWNSQPGRAYQLEYKQHLSDAVWQLAGPPVAGTGAALTLTNTPSAPSQGFFRLEITP